MKIKILKWAAWISAGIVVLFIALGIHLYFVTDHFYQSKGPQLQMGRVDFNEPIDSTEAIQIRGFVNNIDGVQKSYFNLKDNILVFVFYNDKQTSQNIYDRLMASGNYKADKYVVPEDAELSGCPVMSGEGATGGLLLLYKNIFSIFNL